MNNFIYETPTKVYFGKDEELKVGKIIAEFHPKKVLVHFGGNSARKSGLLDKVENCLREENISFVELGGVVANPELPLVREGIARIYLSECQLPGFASVQGFQGLPDDSWLLDQ